MGKKTSSTWAPVEGDIYAVVGKTLRMESVMFTPLQHINSNNCMHTTYNNGTVKRTVNHD